METKRETSSDLKKDNFQERRASDIRFQKSSAITEAMNILLANEFTLFTKTLNYHWNVEGPRFHGIHKFLESHYRELLEMIDEVAERVRVIGGHSVGTVQEYAKLNTLRERPGVFPDTAGMLSDLSESHATICLEIKEILEKKEEYIESPGTEDFLIGLLGKHEEMGWMLRAHLV